MKNYFYNAEKSFYCFLEKHFLLNGWRFQTHSFFYIYIFILDPEMETHLPTVVSCFVDKGHWLWWEKSCDEKRVVQMVKIRDQSCSFVALSHDSVLPCFFLFFQGSSQAWVPYEKFISFPICYFTYNQFLAFWDYHYLFDQNIRAYLVIFF